MSIEDILDHFEKVSSHGGYWKARCPIQSAHSHGDREPSLSIRVKENGWAALKCHGCNADEGDILEAAGLKNIDLLTTAVNFGEPEAIYTYEDADGTPLFQVVRFPGKRFMQRRYAPDHEDADSEGWVWRLDETVPRVLYHLPEVIKGVKEGRTIYVVEGEKDADNMREAWGVIATCNPGGAGKWRKEYAEILAGANVIVIRDKGTASERKHAEHVKTSLQGKAIGIWLMQAKVGKDASDHIDAGFRPEDLEMVQDRVRRGIVSAKEMAKGAMDDLFMTEHDIPGYVLSPQIPIPFRRGRTYAVGAYTGHGKTSYGLPGFRHLAENHYKVGYFSLEMPERDLRNKLLAHKGIPLEMTEQPWRIANDPQWLQHYTDAVNEIERWPSDVIFESEINAKRIKEITEEQEYEVIFVDHLHKMPWTDRRQFEQEMQAVNSIALELNVCVVVMCQLRKADNRPGAAMYPRPTLQSFRETSVIGEECSIALAIWRQTDDSGTSFTGQTMAFVLKNRHTTGPHDAAGKAFLLHFDHKREMFVPESERVQETQ